MSQVVMMNPYIKAAGVSSFTATFYPAADADTPFFKTGFRTEDRYYLQDPDATSHSACRLPSVTIPKDATIDYAELIIYSYNNAYDSLTDTLDIAAEQADDPSQILTSGDGVTRSGNLGTAVECPFSAETVGAPNLPWVFSDIKSVIQGIVNRAGWVSGNAMMIMASANLIDVDTAQGHTYQTGNASGYEPRLYVEWTA